MPQIINPYKSGGTMGEDLFGIGGLADAFFGPKASQSALVREKFKEQARQNEFLPQYANALARGVDPGELGRLAIMAGQTGADVGNYLRVVTANRNPNALDSGPVTAAILGAGGAYSSTPAGTAAQIAAHSALDLEKTNRLIAADKLKNERELISVYAPLTPENPYGITTVTRAEFLANPGKYNQVTSQDHLKGALAVPYLFPGAPTAGAAPGASPFDAGAAPVPFIPGTAASPLAALSALPPTPTIAAAPPIATPSIAAAPLAPEPRAMTPEQRHFLGADPQKQAGKNFYVTDPDTGTLVDQGITLDNGRTRIDGTPIILKPREKINVAGDLNPTAISTLGTAPGKSEQKDFRTAINHADSTLKIGAQILDIVNKNPTAIGLVGNLRRMGQEGNDLLNSLNTMFGTGNQGDYEAAIRQTRQALRQKFGFANAQKLIPELFVDDDLNSITTLNGMLLYKAAAALGQSGRDASDKDIANIRGYVGSPDSWFQGPGTYKSKVSALMRQVQQQRDDDFASLQPGARVGPGTITAPPSTGASTRAAPTAPDEQTRLINKYGLAPPPSQGIP